MNDTLMEKYEELVTGWVKVKNHELTGESTGSLQPSTRFSLPTARVPFTALSSPSIALFLHGSADCSVYCCM